MATIAVYYVTVANISERHALDLSRYGAVDFDKVPRADMGRFYERAHAEAHAEHLKDHKHLAPRVDVREEADDREPVDGFAGYAP